MAYFSDLILRARDMKERIIRETIENDREIVSRIMEKIDEKMKMGENRYESPEVGLLTNLRIFFEEMEEKDFQVRKHTDTTWMIRW